jgi:hypothetical protein
MTRTAADTMFSNMSNYLGVLFLAGKKKTPFLQAIGGGLDGNGMPRNYREAKDWNFPLTNTMTIDAPSQPAITEATAMATATATTYVGAETNNTVQIFQERVTVSYPKMSNKNVLAGLAIPGEVQWENDPFVIQQMMHFRQMAADMDHTMLQGDHQAMAGGSGNAAKTRGIITAIATNAVAAGTHALTTAHMNEAGKDLFDNGADMDNMAIWVNSWQKKKLTDLYGVVPEDRSIGGANITRVITDFFDAPVFLDPNMPTDTVLIADMDYVKPVFLIVDHPTKGRMPPCFYESLAQVGAGEIGHIYCQAGLDYGHEKQHAKITGLTTS